MGIFDARVSVIMAVHYHSGKNLVRLKCKEEAYVVLTEGVRHAWTNWKVWHNYVPLCVDTGHFSAAIRALQRLVDLGHTKEAVDIPVISALVQSIESRGRIPDAAGVKSEQLHSKLQNLLDKLVTTEDGKNNTDLLCLSQRNASI